MEVNEVTIFKLILFSVCVIIVTIFIQKLIVFNPTTGNMCQMLLTKPAVSSSVIADECPSGYLPNYGSFDDVEDEQLCCVKYEVK